MEDKIELIKMRSTFQEYRKACQIQDKLIDIYKDEYQPKHTKADYFDLILKFEVGAITKRHPQDMNYPDTVFECFSVISQHVRGFTKEHCLDQIFEAAVKLLIHD